MAAERCDPWWVRAQVPAAGTPIGQFRGPRRSLRTAALLAAGASPGLGELDLLIPHFTAQPVAESAVGPERRQLPCLRFVGVLDLDLPLEDIQFGRSPLRVGGACQAYPHRTFATGSRQLTKAGRQAFDRDLLAAVRGGGTVEGLGRALTGFEALRHVGERGVGRLRFGIG